MDLDGQRLAEHHRGRESLLRPVAAIEKANHSPGRSSTNGDARDRIALGYRLVN
jgi:hypothetical protein